VRRPRAIVETRSPDRLSRRPPVAQQPSHGPRVLVAEPAVALRNIMTQAFGARGYRVAATASLEDLRRLIVTFAPDVIVAELHLPDGETDALCQELKTTTHRLVPIVLISGLPSEELAERAKLARADRFHPKSRGLGELMDMLDRLTSEILF
jgi:DNA-binding response OmpR family regulator